MILSHKNASQSNFVSNGFHDWKKATTKFNKHQNSQLHKDSTAALVRISRTKYDIGVQMSNEYAQEQEQSRKCLLEILETVRLLGRQSHAFRNY